MLKCEGFTCKTCMQTWLYFRWQIIFHQTKLQRHQINIREIGFCRYCSNGTHGQRQVPRQLCIRHLWYIRPLNLLTSTESNYWNIYIFKKYDLLMWYLYTYNICKFNDYLFKKYFLVFVVPVSVPWIVI